MDHYELVYIVSIKYLEDDFQKVMDKVASLVKDCGAEITGQEVVGKQRLAYPIKQIGQGTYVAVEFNLEPAALKKLNGQVRLQPEILRHLITKKRIKSAEEVSHEKSIQERLRREKETELSKMEEKEKASYRKERPLVTREVKAEPAPEVETSLKKKDDKAKVSLDDLDKKLDEILTEEVL